MYMSTYMRNQRVTLELWDCFLFCVVVVVVLFLRQGLIDLSLLSRPGRLASEPQGSASSVLELPVCAFTPGF